MEKERERKRKEKEEERKRKGKTKEKRDKKGLSAFCCYFLNTWLSPSIEFIYSKKTHAGWPSDPVLKIIQGKIHHLPPRNLAESSRNLQRTS